MYMTPQGHPPVSPLSRVSCSVPVANRGDFRFLVLLRKRVRLWKVVPVFILEQETPECQQQTQGVGEGYSEAKVFFQ